MSSFYFFCGRSDRFDAEYVIKHPAMRGLLLLIHAQGHKIGLHPSYDCFDNSVKLRNEAEWLWNVCAQEAIQQSGSGADALLPLAPSGDLAHME